MLVVLIPMQAAYAVGDLLVAPTRLVMADKSGAEVLLNNKGGETATYRVSLVLKKMLPDGRFEDVVEPDAEQQRALDMISYAPRKVVLAPGQTQTVRLGARAAVDLPDGEYRVHMLFRAIPDDNAPVSGAGAAQGLSIMLRPVYGVTIPVITRKGVLSAQAKVDNIRLVREGKESAIAFDIERSGNRSISGTISVLRAGKSEPIAMMKGVSVYPELTRRTVIVPLSAEDRAALSGTITVRFSEETGDPSPLVAEAQARL